MLPPRQFVFGLMPLLLFGCVSHAPRPEVPRLDTASRFSVAPATGPSSTAPWWQQALEQDLAERTASMLAANPSVRLAAQDVAIQQARLDGSEADRGWEVVGSAQGKLQTRDGDGSGSAQAGIDASLPLDLFDRLQQGRDAVSFELARSRAKLEQTRLQQVQAFVLAHIDAAEAQQLQQLLSQQIETAQTLLRLTEFRFSQGLVSSVDVLQQREQLASLRLQPVEVRLSARQAMTHLASLQGRLPEQVEEAPQGLPGLAENFSVATPAELIQRRPDLVEKRAALLASDRRYAAALNAHLPDASLSAGALLRLVSGDASEVLNAAIDASISLFDSGALQASSAEHRAELERAGIDYLSSWLDAVRETDDLLQGLQINSERLRLSERRTRVASNLFDATRRRYERGITDYLPVLAALRSLQQQQRDHLGLRVQRLRLIVRLHTAMGLPEGRLLPGQAEDRT